MFNTRATEREAGVQSLQVRTLVYNCQEERRLQGQSETVCVYTLSAPLRPNHLVSFHLERRLQNHTLQKARQPWKRDMKDLKWLKYMQWGWELKLVEKGGGKFMENDWNPFSFDFLESGTAFGPWHVRQIPIGHSWQKCVPSTKFTIKLNFIWPWSKYFSKYKMKAIAYFTFERESDRERLSLLMCPM